MYVYKLHAVIINTSEGPICPDSSLPRRHMCSEITFPTMHLQTYAGIDKADPNSSPLDIHTVTQPFLGQISRNIIVGGVVSPYDTLVQENVGNLAVLDVVPLGRSLAR